MKVSRFLFLFLLVQIPFVSSAQIALQGGANFCRMRNNDLIKNQGILTTPHAGVTIQYYPFSGAPEISFENGFLFNTKGYRLKFDETYDFRLRYFSFPLWVHYSVHPKIDLVSGLEFNYLNETNVVKGTETYHRFDVGILAGIETSLNNSAHPYLRISYGCIPTLHYYSFDAFGNFINEFNDLKNLVLSVGIKINLSNDKIEF